jgi:hypothetical protein
MRIVAIDPGSTQSAFVEYDTDTALPISWAKQPNETMLLTLDDLAADALAIEMIASYGMAVGAEVFETAVWSGRFIERYLATGADELCQIFRREVKLHLCGNQRAKDPNIRQALIDRYGPGKDKAVGLKASPGPLYGIGGDCWSALGVAVTAAETRLATTDRMAA